MKGNQLPRSLHTVRILRLLAEQTVPSPGTQPTEVLERAVLRAAALCEYPKASKNDPLVQLAVHEMKRRASKQA